MSALRPLNRLTIFLLFLALLLGFWVYSMWKERAALDQQNGAAEVAPKQVSRIGATLQRPATYVPPSINVFNEILERPLFTQGRLPPEEPAATVAVQPRAQLRLRLEGVAITEDRRVALVRDLTNNQLVRLHEGMEHQGWTVNGVQADSAEFKRGDEILELVLDMEKNNKSTSRGRFQLPSASRRR